MNNKERLALRKFLAPEFVYGSGARMLVPQYARNYSLSKVLVVTDTGLLGYPWPHEVCDQLHGAGIATELFAHVAENPRDLDVMAGAELFRETGCSGIVVVGGGSPIDCAKGIGIVTSNGGSILDYVGIDRIPLPSPPLICVPTTAGSSADLSQFAIISNTRARLKQAIVSRALVPDVSLVDPEVTVTMPFNVTAQSGIDCLTHSIEAVLSNASAPITDLLALEAVRLVRDHLPGALQNPDSYEHRDGMLLATVYAGIAFSNASLGMVHAMAHSLGGLLDLPHGTLNGILLLPVMRFNYEAASREYVRLATALGLDIAHSKAATWNDLLFAEIEQLLEACHFPKRIADLGITEKDLAQLSQNAYQDPCLVTNPRPVSPEDLERVYRELL